MFNYIYKQRVPIHDERSSVAIGAGHMEVWKNMANVGIGIEEQE